MEVAENEFQTQSFHRSVHLDVRGLLLLPKGQPAQEVEESADLLRCQVVHVVQGSLCQTDHSVKNKNARTNTLIPLYRISPIVTEVLAAE